MSATLPAWAAEMRDLFRSGAVAQFLVHGNVFDGVPVEGPDGGRLVPLPMFLDEVMFPAYDVVLHYDRGRGGRAVRGAAEWGEFVRGALGDAASALAQLREPGAALELIDRFLLRSLNLTALRGDVAAAPPRIAVVIEFAEFVVPRGDPLQLGGSFPTNVVKVLGWANDPAVLRANVVTVLIAERLHDLNALVVDNPHVATLHVPLPDEAAMRAHLEALVAGELRELPARSDLGLDVLARRLTGLSRVGARRALAVALERGDRVTAAWLSDAKKTLIERECDGLLDFLESPYTLDDIAGHDAIKAWLRDDVALLRRGALHAFPMGYLIAGRIGTGKTFLVQCWAGEIGIPCVVLKNFRDRWVGATEANLEKIFAVLRALGQVVVFVDEADQAAGRREGGSGDSGLSGRVYGMLAAEMAQTRNRGRIIWVFATSRPDLLEVDLKRQGRLDVRVPLFPPETAPEVQALLVAVARKLRVTVGPDDVPPLPAGLVLGGNEIEGALVRALRLRELAPEPRPPLREVLARVFAEVRPSADTRRLEYMDLVAVKECTDRGFLPARFRDLSPEDVERRLAELRPYV